MVGRYWLTRGRGRLVWSLAGIAAATAAGGVGLLLGGWGGDVDPPPPAPETIASDVALPPERAESRPRGGIARVAVWMEPDVAAPTLGGAAVRALVHPQLFVARPDGRWESSLAASGSDRTGREARTATFRIAERARWSDGAAITVDDLRRTADRRWVEGIDGPDAQRQVTVRFTQPLPGWRRLWSGVDSVAPAREGVWGGAFVLGSYTPGLEAVLRRNPGWWGSGPFLDEVRLVLVPDPTTARQLLERGQLDVVSPLAYPQRTPRLRAVRGVKVEQVARGGWWVGLMLNTSKVDSASRRALFATVDRRPFVGTLLAGEAAVLDGFAGPEDATWKPIGVGDARGIGKVQVTSVSEEPLSALLLRAMQKRARAVDGELEPRQANMDEVEAWLADGAYEAAVSVMYDGPVVCWSCRWGGVDAELAAAADAGNFAAAVALESRVRDEAHTLPLWRPFTTVAWRDDVKGARANGYALSAADHAWNWWREK